MIDNAHALVNHSEFDPFGKILKTVNASRAVVNSNTLAIDAAFAGREWDDEAGLYYNRARWYDAAEGRFISEDSLGLAAGDASVYRYAAGDPVNGHDPSGLFFKKFFREVKRVVNDVGDAIEDAGDYVEDKYKDTVRSLEYVARNPDDAFKSAVKDPWFWAGLTVGSVTFSWGFFNASYGLGGFNNGINFLDLGRQALNLTKGGGLGLGLPTISVNSPLASLAKGAINGVLRQGASGYSVIQTGYEQELTGGQAIFRGQSPEAGRTWGQYWGEWGDFAYEGGAGLARGGANLVQAGQNVLGELYNIPAAGINGIASAEEYFGILDGGSHSLRLPYYDKSKFDWSRNLVRPEYGEPGSWSDMHGWSVFGGEAAIEAGTAAKALVKSAARMTFAPAQTADMMAETGQLGGKLYDSEKLAKLQRYLERRGIALNPARNGSFNGVKGVMELPLNPTVLNVRHELSHMLDYKKYGMDYYKKFNQYNREEMVLDRLMNNRVWNTLNETEKSWSSTYPLTRQGGQVW